MGRAAPDARAPHQGAPLLDPLLRRAPGARQKRGRVGRLLDALVRRGRERGLLTPGATVAVDATGLETHPASAYYRDRRNRVKEFIALRDIRPGEEITINYNGSPADPSDVGFPTL